MDETTEEGAGRIPLLVTDPTALMLKYILLSPVHLSQGECGWFDVWPDNPNTNQ